MCELDSVEFPQVGVASRGTPRASQRVAPDGRIPTAWVCAAYEYGAGGAGVAAGVAGAERLRR